MVSFSFYGELQARCYFVKAFQDVVYVRFAYIVGDEDIVYITEIALISWLTQSKASAKS
jgi:hypothetical protein